VSNSFLQENVCNLYKTLSESPFQSRHFSKEHLVPLLGHLECDIHQIYIYASQVNNEISNLSNKLSKCNLLTQTHAQFVHEIHCGSKTEPFLCFSSNFKNGLISTISDTGNCQQAANLMYKCLVLRQERVPRCTKQHRVCYRNWSPC